MISTEERTVSTLHIEKDIEVAAPVDITFQAVLAELGPGSQMPDGSAFPMKFEPWPGGRWYRDLGNNSGHLWGHVQVIKPPPHPQPLLEICGPMFMSYPAINFVQYRLVAEGRLTRVKITHRAMGLISDDHREGVGSGWEHGLNRIRLIAAELLAGKRAPHAASPVAPR